MMARALSTEPGAERYHPTLGVFCDYTEPQNVVNVNQRKYRLEGGTGKREWVQLSE